MTAAALRKLCLSFAGAVEEFPFGPEALELDLARGGSASVERHRAGRDDDVSLFLLSEFVLHAQAAEEGVTVVEDVEALAEEVEEQLVEVEEQDVDPAQAADRATAQLAPDE